MSKPVGYHTHVTEYPAIGRRDLDMLLRYVSPTARFLDIGCSSGMFLEICHQKGYHAIGLDRNRDALNSANPSLRLLLGDGRACPFAGSTFDVVRAKEILKHVPEPRSLVAEIIRLLKPGGVFRAHVPTVFSQYYPVANFYDDHTHVRPFTRVSLGRLLEDAGLHVVSITGYTFGRNIAERVLGSLLAPVAPHQWLALARK